MNSFKDRGVESTAERQVAGFVCVDICVPWLAYRGKKEKRTKDGGGWGRKEGERVVRKEGREKGRNEERNVLKEGRKEDCK